MTTLHHTLVSLLYLEGNQDMLKELIPYILFPDAIRNYTNFRQCSHFEKNSDQTETSYLSYPKDINNLTPDNVTETTLYLANESKFSVIGEDISLESFKQHNTHLNSTYYNGVLLHLVEDSMFDQFVRNKIDCSDKYNDNFNFNNENLNGLAVRKLISDIDSQSIQILSVLLEKNYGIKPNQEWFDNVIKPTLFAAYPNDLAKSTYTYMQYTPKLHSQINENITSDGPLQTYDFLELYKEVFSMLEKEHLQYKNHNTQNGMEI